MTVRPRNPVWASRRQRLAIATVIVAAALGLGGAGLPAHRVGAAPAQQPSSTGSSSAAPNSATPLAGGTYTPYPSSPNLPLLPPPGAPGRTPQPTPTPVSAPQLAGDGIPAVALDAYRKAAAHLAATDPGCGLPWPLLAAIGRVESDHGRFAGSQIYSDGTDAPRVIGIALDGQGTALIRDTDHGVLDGDTVYDRAVGPMQFIPSTWAVWGVDGNGDGVASPFNIYDAALAAADYLCAAGGNLQTAAGQIRAVLAYNDSDAYLATVLALEKIYAAGQPGVTIPILPSVPKPPAHEKPLPAPVNPGPPLAFAPAATSPSAPGTTPRLTPNSGSPPGSTTPPGSTSPPSSSPPSSSPPSSSPPSSSPPSSSPPSSSPPSSPGAPPTSPHPSPTPAPLIAALTVTQTPNGGSLDITADASGTTGGSAGRTYAFDFGVPTDPAAVVRPQQGATAEYIYPAAGAYKVTVTVTDSAGHTSTKTLEITVPLPPPSTTSSTTTSTGSTSASTGDSTGTSSTSN